MSYPTLGLALIAKDEETTLPRLLASVEGAFDQIVLLDTGSSDRTVEVFEEWADAEKKRQPGFVTTLGNFEWVDDFAAARNAADDLLETDWWCWADCDDVIIGAEGMRRLVKRTPTHVTHWRFPYDRDGEDAGGRWARLRRSGVGIWVGRLHEGFRGLDSPCGDGDDIRWRSDRNGMRAASRDRDLRVLRAWTTDEPRNLRPLGMLAVAEFEEGNREAALRCFERYVEIRYAEVDDSIARWEKEAAVWALGKLRAAVLEMDRGDRHYWDTFDFAVTILLSRRQASVFGATITCAENRYNPEPAHEPHYAPAPMTRQQRRAEARQRAKALARWRGGPKTAAPSRENQLGYPSRRSTG
jgi:glycosyltransferase involved in cell wall biosynthesis